MKILKWVLIVLGSLIVLLLIFYGFVYYKTQSRINKQYQVSLQNIFIPSDSASYIRGKRIATNRGCMGCHGPDLGGGRAFLDEKTPLGILYAMNITSGKGGLQFTDADWIRVLRHGLDRENKSVWFMPSQDIYEISNQDLGDLLNYVKNQPPVDRTVPAHSLKPLGRFIVFRNQFPLLSAEMINQNAVFKDSVQATITPAYGGYLATTCMGCHGSQFKGSLPHSPGEPPIPNISSTGDLSKWTSEGFVNVFHTGIIPEGRKLDDHMPWKEFKFTDNELKAIYLYLQTVK